MCFSAIYHLHQIGAHDIGNQYIHVFNFYHLYRAKFDIFMKMHCDAKNASDEPYAKLEREVENLKRQLGTSGHLVKAVVASTDSSEDVDGKETTEVNNGVGVDGEMLAGLSGGPKTGISDPRYFSEVDLEDLRALRNFQNYMSRFPW